MGLLFSISVVRECRAHDTSKDHLTPFGRQSWVEKKIGPQIEALSVRSVLTAPQDTAYLTLMGYPWRIAKVNLGTGKALCNVPLPEWAAGATLLPGDTTPSIFLSGAGHGIYRFDPDTQVASEVGQTSPPIQVLYGIVQVNEDEVVGGGYPAATMFRMNTKTGAFQQLPRASAAEDYARSIAYDKTSDLLYVGVGSHAGLIEWNLATGERKDILPEAFRNEQFVEIKSVQKGELKFGLLPSGKTVALDLKKNVATDTAEITGAVTVGDGKGEDRYLLKNGTLQRVDSDSGKTEDLHVKVSGNVVAYLPPPKEHKDSLRAILDNGTVFSYDPTNGTTSTRKLDLMPCPIRIHNVATGPGDVICTTGYVIGDLGIYDPVTGSRKQIGRIRQVEGFSCLDSMLYLGTYPHARIFTFDTSRKQGGNNPDLPFTLEKEGQDRPFAMLPVREENKVFIGTLSTYGQLGGALSVSQLGSTTATVYRNVVPNQSVVTLAYRDGIVYGGTTVYGGLGIEPTEREARLFAWDARASRKPYDLAPVPGKKGLSGFAFDADGKLWGWAEGTLFIFDPASRRVEYAEQKFVPEGEVRHFWRGGCMTGPVDGKFYGSMFGRVYVLDTKSRQTDVIAQGPNIEQLAPRSDGSLYFIDGADLYCLTPKPKAP